MARNGSGTYSKVNTFSASATITASGHNQNWDDIALEITNSVAADGQTPITGALKGANGSASAPAYGFNSDANTGAYRIGADNYGIAVGGSKVVDVASTGVTVTGDVDATVVKQATYRLVPAGLISPYAGSSAPDGWLLCYGQAVSRTTYSDLFTAISTTYGTGDGSTTFNLPDIRGRAIAGQDDMGGTSANRLTGLTDGVDGDTLGGTGGKESCTLSADQTPELTGTTSTADDHDHAVSGGVRGGTGNDATVGAGGSTGVLGNSVINITPAGSHDHTVTVNSGGGAAHNNVQPTIILNYIIKF